MRPFIRKVFISILTVSIVSPIPPVHASPVERHPLSIAVVPVSDGDSDAESRELAQELGSSLKLITNHHIVESDLSAEILKYNDYGTDRPADLREAEEALSLAKERYFQFRYAEAEKELGRAIALLEKKRGNMAEAGAPLADAYVSRAVFARSRGSEAQARQSLSDALRINPALNLAAENYPPSLVSLFNEVSRQVKSGPTGSIAVETNPKAAEVFVNGIQRGVTPTEIKDLPAGSYSLEIRAGKYAPVKRTVEVTAGARVALREKLGWAKESRRANLPKAENEAALVREGLRIANQMKADKVVLVNVAASGSKNKIEARMVDGRLGVGQPPIIIALNDGDNQRAAKLARMARLLADQTIADISSDPAHRAKPLGIGDPSLLDKRRRPLHKNPIFWGIVGALAAGAVGGGIAAAMSGGDSGGPGSLKVSFK
ncbi:MAG: PEGA domain-containing protein [Pseudomonadota bacterium]